MIVQGAVFAGITITEGWSADPYALTRTGDIGLFKITGESGVAAGIRRVEATTGHGALRLINGNKP